MSEALTSGIHHLGLTVSHLEEAKEFFISALGFSLVAERADYPAAFVSDGTVLLTLWQASSEKPTAFDRKSNLGLHHFALRLSAQQELSTVYERLKDRDDVEIEFAPENLGKGPTQHMMCTIPGGLRMEIIAPAK